MWSQTWRRTSFCFLNRYSAFFFDLSDKNFSKLILPIDRFRKWNTYFLDFSSPFSAFFYQKLKKNLFLENQITEANKRW